MPLLRHQKPNTALMAAMKNRFSEVEAPGPRLTWVALAAIALVIGLPVALVLELTF